MCDAQIVLFRAIGLPPDLPKQLLGVPPLRIEELMRASARGELERLAGTMTPGLVEGISTELATAWDGIVREARRVDADLIVIGSHGFGGLDRLLGTTAAKVVNHADRNVLIVRTPL
jgi:nucleotide-binding universal stress UspA family protein